LGDHTKFGGHWTRVSHVAADLNSICILKGSTLYVDTVGCASERHCYFEWSAYTKNNKQFFPQLGEIIVSNCDGHPVRHYFLSSNSHV